MEMWIKLILLFGISSNVLAVSNKTDELATCATIPTYEGCACQMSNSKEIVGLQFLTTNDTLKRKPRFIAKDPDTQWYFAFHPCGSFNMFLNYSGIGDFACKGDAAARYNGESAHQCSGLGKPSSGDFLSSGNPLHYPSVSNLTLTYRNESAVDKGGMSISLICNNSIRAEDSIFTYINRTVEVKTTYFFSLESECCCPGKCKDGIKIPHKKTDDAVWYIVGAIIVLLLLIIMVFVIVYAKYHPRSTAAENAPLIT